MHEARLKQGTVSKVSLAAVALVLAAVVLALAATQKPAQAAFPGENGRIAFSAPRTTGESGNDIWTTTPDGTELSQLTFNTSDDLDPAWSADGTKMAFSSTRTTGEGVDNPTGDSEIFTMKADGTNVTQLTFNTSDDLDPAWSPDGSKVAFSGVGAGSTYYNPLYDIFVMNSDGSGLTNITNTASSYYESQSEHSPDWSPDGSKIAFSSLHYPWRGSDWRIDDLYVMNPDGSGRVQLTTTPTLTSYSDADWSPDGSKIAFRRSYFHHRGDDWYYFSDIYVMNPDGSGQMNLTPDLVENPAYETAPAWSPDGTKIAFRTGIVNARIHTMNTDGSNQTQITNSPTSRGSSLDWQPLPDPTLPTAKAQCKKGGYEEFGFKNQGRCVAYVDRAAKNGR